MNHFSLFSDQVKMREQKRSTCQNEGVAFPRQNTQNALKRSIASWLQSPNPLFEKQSAAAHRPFLFQKPFKKDYFAKRPPRVVSRIAQNCAGWEFNELLEM
eukprot:TRINITY_DN9377_c0_g2_i2.p4 TRINITY_DN9377_c0_g2~~TRINITY_DN9377_c0_g2_i2.p4  ORF type:complete len:101 (+),score=11.13 TRINITY_DN9377_c0_g2_i2:280-582(+)